MVLWVHLCIYVILALISKLKMAKEHARGGDGRETHSTSASKILCTDCKIDLNCGKVNSIKWDFCKSMFCFKCSKLKQALFNVTGKEESILWTCVHCRIAAPGVNLMEAQLRNLEKKVADIEKMVSASKELPKLDKELIATLLDRVLAELYGNTCVNIVGVVVQNPVASDFYRHKICVFKEITKNSA